MAARTYGSRDNALGKKVRDPVFFTRVYLCHLNDLLPRLRRLYRTSSVYIDNPDEPRDNDSIFFKSDGKCGSGRVEMVKMEGCGSVPVYLEDNQRSPGPCLKQNDLDYLNYPRAYYHSILVTNPIQIPKYSPTGRDCSMPIVLTNVPQPINKIHRIPRRENGERALIRKMQRLNHCGQKVTASVGDSDTDDDSVIEEHIKYLKKLKVSQAGQKVNSYRYQITELERRYREHQYLINKSKDNETILMPPPPIPRIDTSTGNYQFTAPTINPPRNISEKEQVRWRDREAYGLKLDTLRKRVPHDVVLVERAKRKHGFEISEKKKAGTYQDPVQEWYKRQKEASGIDSVEIDLAQVGWNSDDDDDNFLILNQI